MFLTSGTVSISDLESFAKLSLFLDSKDGISSKVSKAFHKPEVQAFQ